MENIIYIPNHEAFLQELQDKEIEIVNKTPIVIKDNKALFVTVDSLDLESIEVLGDYDEIFRDEAKLAKYKLVNDFETPIGQDEEGNDIFPNKYVGSFGLPSLTAEELKAKTKKEGKIYTLNDVDYVIPFMKDDADGVIQVLLAFMRNAFEHTVLSFSNGVKMPISKVEYDTFAMWFANERNNFFTEEV